MSFWRLLHLPRNKVGRVLYQRQQNKREAETESGDIRYLNACNFCLVLFMREIYCALEANLYDQTCQTRPYVQEFVVLIWKTGSITYSVMANSFTIGTECLVFAKSASGSKITTSCWLMNMLKTRGLPNNVTIVPVSRTIFKVLCYCIQLKYLSNYPVQGIA